MKNLSLLLLSFFFMACADGPQPSEVAVVQEIKPTVQNVKMADVQQIIDTTKSLQILDVRTPNEWKEGVIEGAILIDYFSDDFKTELAKLNPDIPVLVYCRSGGRSTKAAKELINLGNKEVYNMIEGATMWYQTGRKTISPSLNLDE